MSNKHYIPYPVLENFCRHSSVEELSNNKAKKLFTYANALYVITGYASSGVSGYLWATACKVVPLKQYKGTLKPLNYNQSNIEVNEGLRDRGYAAQLFTYGTEHYVTLGTDTIFYPTPEGTQTSMF
ncbi:hypothetical protein NBRC110019_07670 [Neptunitalea chrysea]|uniref:Uncharacterized protein n=1 Tax=Neptunitalea chrysea TaxID=1647581 RepID=A0A9W6EVM6_9FLAO|nr:hypothetical protein [Neptunitalea chrysea]GLB51728.1 hypothetical protein NBRC110019_07670 [Neptunitalea chrysea]